MEFFFAVLAWSAVSTVVFFLVGSILHWQKFLIIADFLGWISKMSFYVFCVALFFVIIGVLLGG